MQGKVRSQESIEWRMSNIQHFKGRAVLIIRNPFAALVSSWRHVMKDNSIDPSHQAYYDYFQRYALSEVKVWREIAIDWLLVGKEVIFLHYEDISMDATEQLERVLNFLNLKASEDRLKVWKCSVSVNTRGKVNTSTGNGLESNCLKRLKMQSGR